MREQVRDRGRLEHILQAVDKVFEFTKDVKREDFKKDSILYFAMVKNIENASQIAEGHFSFF